MSHESEQNAGPQGSLVIRYPKVRWAQPLSVTIDGKRLGTVTPGDELRRVLPPGRHKLVIKDTWAGSPPEPISVEAERTTVITCDVHYNWRYLGIEAIAVALLFAAVFSPMQMIIYHRPALNVMWWVPFMLGAAYLSLSALPHLAASKWANPYTCAHEATH